jgi:hypothetical protein
MIACPAPANGRASSTRCPRRRIAAMVLYTCPARTHGANAPLIKHPCGVAAQALDRAGHAYTVKVVGGFKNVPFSRMGKRAEIRTLTGRDDVPVLLLDDGSIVQGSHEIADWATTHPAAASA